MGRSQVAAPAPTQPQSQTSSENRGSVSREPSHNEISKLAHSYWLQRRAEDGTAEDDWFRAEKALRENAVETDL